MLAKAKQHRRSAWIAAGLLAALTLLAATSAAFGQQSPPNTTVEHSGDATVRAAEHHGCSAEHFGDATVEQLGPA